MGQVETSPSLLEQKCLTDVRGHEGIDVATERVICSLRLELGCLDAALLGCLDAALLSPVTFRKQEALSLNRRYFD